MNQRRPALRLCAGVLLLAVIVLQAPQQTSAAAKKPPPPPPAPPNEPSPPWPPYPSEPSPPPDAPEPPSPNPLPPKPPKPPRPPKQPPAPMTPPSPPPVHPPPPSPGVKFSPPIAPPPANSTAKKVPSPPPKKDASSNPKTYTGILEVLVPLYVVMLIGYYAGRKKMVDEFTLDRLNSFNAKFALPALLYKNIAETELYHANWNVVGADICFKVIMGAIVLVIAKFAGGKGSPAERFMVAHSICSLPNYIVIGLPVLSAIYPPAQVKMMMALLLLEQVAMHVPLIAGFMEIVLKRGAAAVGEHHVGALMLGAMPTQTDAHGFAVTLGSAFRQGDVKKFIRILSHPRDQNYWDGPDAAAAPASHPQPEPEADEEAAEGSAAGTNRGSVSGRGSASRLRGGEESQRQSQHGSLHHSVHGSLLPSLHDAAIPSLMDAPHDSEHHSMHRSATESSAIGRHSAAGSARHSMSVVGSIHASQSTRSMHKADSVVSPDGVGGLFHPLGEHSEEENEYSDDEPEEHHPTRGEELMEIASARGDGSSRQGSTRQPKKAVNRLFSRDERDGAAGAAGKPKKQLHRLFSEPIEAPKADSEMKRILRIVRERLLTNPLVLAAVAGVVTSLAVKYKDPGQRVPYILITIATYLNNTVLGVSLFNFGLFAHVNGIVACTKAEMWGVLFGRCIFSPALNLLVMYILGIRGVILKIMVLQGALPQAVSSFVIFKEFKCRPDVFSTSLVVGTGLCLPTICIWFLIMEQVSAAIGDQ